MQKQQSRELDTENKQSVDTHWGVSQLVHVTIHPIHFKRDPRGEHIQ